MSDRLFERSGRSSASPRDDPKHDGVRKHDAQRQRQTAALAALRSHRDACASAGVGGWDLFERMATLSLSHRTESSQNRCRTCWHDAATGCICGRVPILRKEDLPPRGQLRVKLTVLMHHKEYLCAGNTAKLLLSMLPNGWAELYVFGREGDLDSLIEDIRTDDRLSRRTMTLWPGEEACTVREFLNDASSRVSSGLPSVNDDDCGVDKEYGEGRKNGLTLRVVVLDGTYSNAKHMAKALRKRLGECAPRNVALHPSSASVFRRAQKSYGTAMTKGLRNNSKSASRALRVSTAEAVAQLLVELGGKESVRDSIVAAVMVNNEVLCNHQDEPSESNLKQNPVASL